MGFFLVHGWARWVDRRGRGEEGERVVIGVRVHDTIEIRASDKTIIPFCMAGMG